MVRLLPTARDTGRRPFLFPTSNYSLALPSTPRWPDASYDGTNFGRLVSVCTNTIFVFGGGLGGRFGAGWRGLFVPRKFLARLMFHQRSGGSKRGCVPFLSAPCALRW
jgi:hypothetical protein